MAEFKRNGNIVMTKSGNHFVELAQYGDYAILMRLHGDYIDEKPDCNRLEFEPYVAAYGYDKEDGVWGQGAYFSDLFDAVDYAKSRFDERHISYARMSEIATKAIDGLFEDDSESAYEYCKDEIEMTEEEMDYFGVEQNYE